MEAINQALTGIRDNSKLKEIITMVLKIGNYLNFGTNKGKAVGFQMELLLQLSNIKSVGKVKISLLEYLIKSIRKNDPSLLKFSNDLVTCDLASKIELTILEDKVKEFDKGLEKIKKELDKTDEQIAQLQEDLGYIEEIEYSGGLDKFITPGGPENLP